MFAGPFAASLGLLLVLAQGPSRPSVDGLPPELRTHADLLLSDEGEGKRTPAIKALADADPKLTLPLLLWVMDNDPSPVIRGAVVARLARRKDPTVRAAIARVAAVDPDPQNAVSALERLHTMNTLDGVDVLARRVAEARAAGDLVAARRFAAEHERWLHRRHGAAVPGFLRTPPPVFSMKTRGRRVRVLAFGDFGNGSPAQLRVAAAMQKFHRRERFDFGITAGDNFYSVGLSRPDDPRWQSQWEALYSPLRIPIQAVLGNHDWGHPDSPAAEILYSQKSKSWRLPAPYYTFTAGPAQFFALDTDAVSEAQLFWLEDELNRSTARWKIVYGHHPIYSHGKHGDTTALVNRLLPLIQDRADAYICGHEHDLQHLRTDGRLELFVTGGGGANVRPIETGPRSVWGKSSYGFTVLDIDAAKLRVRFIDDNLQLLHEHTMDARIAEAP